MKITDGHHKAISSVLIQWEDNATELAKIIANQTQLGPFATKGLGPLLAQMEADLYRIDGAKAILNILNILDLYDYSHNHEGDEQISNEQNQDRSEAPSCEKDVLSITCQEAVDIG